MMKIQMQIIVVVISLLLVIEQCKWISMVLIHHFEIIYQSFKIKNYRKKENSFG